MADVSILTLPNGTTVNIKDAWARQKIEEMGDFTEYLGKTTTPLTDGATTNPITIAGEPVTATKGDIVLYGNAEFIFDGTNWAEFGTLGALGDLAYKDEATGTFTPSGSVSAPTISLKTAGQTTTVKNPSSETVAKTVEASAPGQTAPSNPVTYCSYDSATETLKLYQLGYTTGASISTSNVTVKTGDAEYEASAPTFTGTEGNVTVS